MLNFIIIHQTHYKKSDWSRAFNQFTIACELDIINAISAADISDFHITRNAFCFPHKILHNYCFQIHLRIDDNSLSKILWGKPNALWVI